MTLKRKKANFRGHHVSHERKFRGNLKQSRAKSPFFEGQGKPCFKHKFYCFKQNTGTFTLHKSPNDFPKLNLKNVFNHLVNEVVNCLYQS